MIKKTPLIIITVVSFLCGMLLYAWFSNWIIFNPPHHFSAKTENKKTIEKKQIPLFYAKQNDSASEKKELLWSDDTTRNAITLIKAWLSLLDEEELLIKKTSLQTAAYDEQHKLLYISFDRPPFNEGASTFTKWYLLETFLKTLHSAVPSIEHVAFLVHHQPLQDYHLDFSRPWPTSGFATNNDTPSYDRLFADKSRITIMLDPAGDAQNTGRIIGDSFERGITLQCAEKLKDIIEAALPHVRVILTRFPGETLEPLQNAAFANRLQADFYCALNFYQEEYGISRCFLYYFVYDPITDFWTKRDSTLTFVPHNQAHTKNITKSRHAACNLYNALFSSHQQGRLCLERPIGIPFKPLVGVVAPALGCEIGLQKKDDWHLFVEPLAQALIDLCQGA